MSEVWDGLVPSECGFVLAAALDGRGGSALAEGLTECSSKRCRGALDLIDRLPSTERAAALGRLARDVLSAFPKGVQQVHPSWLRAAFCGERDEVLRSVLAGAPPEVREAVLAGVGPGESERLAPEVVGELRRAALAAIIPACGGGEAGRLRGLTPLQLQDELCRRGARVMGAALRGSSREAILHAAASAGERWGVVVAESAAATGAGGHERDEARAVVAVAAGVDGIDRVLAVGMADAVRTLRDQGGDEAVMQVAQRLPLELGRAMLQM